MKEMVDPRIKFLRILIFSSPKMGNNWLSLLLASIYRIPQVTIQYEVEREQDGRARKDSFRLLDLPMKDCVGHEHIWPSREVLKCIEDEGIYPLTLLRHPADAFISLYHYVNRTPHVPGQRWRSFLRNQDLNDEGIFIFLKNHFYVMFLERTLQWLSTDQAISVRFEDLKHHPKPTLMRLTRRIQPVDENLLDEAIDFCTFEKMRRLNQGLRTLCRKGEVGEWKSTLTEKHIEILRGYQGEIEQLGYSLDY